VPSKGKGGGWKRREWGEKGEGGKKKRGWLVDYEKKTWSKRAKKRAIGWHPNTQFMKLRTGPGHKKGTRKQKGA